MKQLPTKSIWFFFFRFLLLKTSTFLLIMFWIFVFLLGSTESQLKELMLWFFAIIPLFFIFLYVWAKLTYRNYRYELLDHEFKQESGVIYKIYITIPYDRIQNVDIVRGIWARILGLSCLYIQTAAGGEGRLLGLLGEDAEKLREELVRLARISKGQGV